MANISISAYVISIRDSLLRENIQLNNLSGLKFIDVFENFMHHNERLYENNSRLEKVFKFDNYDIVRNIEDGLFQYVFGTIKTGSYGQISEIINSNTGEKSYTRGCEEADVMPFNFIMAIPIGEVNRAIIIFQRIGNYGVKTIFKDEFSRYIREKYSNLKVAINSIAPTTYIKKILDQGILKKVRFFRYSIPNERCEQLGINNGIDNDAYEEYIINKPIGFLRRYKNKIIEVIHNQSFVNNIVEIEGFKYDNLKMEFKLGKKNKTINLQDINSLNLSEDITNLVTLNGGHPTQESIKPILIENAEEYLIDMGLIIRG